MSADHMLYSGMPLFMVKSASWTIVFISVFYVQVSIYPINAIAHNAHMQSALGAARGSDDSRRG